MFQEEQEQADFVFKGTVEQLGASAMAEVEASDSTAVVVVDEVVHAPDQFRDLQGQKVTVQLAEAGSVSEGDRAVFFTVGWLFGESIAVRELEHRPADEGSERAAAITGSAEHGSDRLKERLDTADVVVAGRVTIVRPPEQSVAAALGAEAPSGPVTEHDPQWWEAVVHVDQVLKGPESAVAAATPEPVTVLFPGSSDIAWYDAPKFRPGQEGVFFLHGEQVPAAAAA